VLVSSPPLRAVLALAFLAAAGVFGLAAAPPARAAGCPTQSFLAFDHLAYASKEVPAGIALHAGPTVGSGTVDAPTSADGCKRSRTSVQVLRTGSLEPQVAVMVGGRPRTVFVIGRRCAGFTGTAYWDCLLSPLVFDGRRYTGTAYPTQPGPRKTVPLGAVLGRAELGGARVTVRRIQGVDPALAVGVEGRPSEAFLTASTCPYEGFANTVALDDLSRCLRSPVWFTFDPPGGEQGTTVVGRADRTPAADVLGASISLVRLPLVADLVPASGSTAARVGRVGRTVSFAVPDVPSGLYEAVVTCPRCAAAAGGKTRFPTGSILVSAKPKTSVAVRIVSYSLTAAVIVAIILSVRQWRRRRRSGPGPTPGGPAGS